MKIGFILYDGMTALDLVGVYDPLVRLKTAGFIPDLQWEICVYSSTIKDSTGLLFTATQVRGSLDGYDMIVVPGGFGARKLIRDDDFINWIKTAEPCRLKISVCTGSLLLGAAGFLKDKKATTHRSAFDILQEFGALVVDERIVDEGDVITARGVTSAIDLGLYLCNKLAGIKAEKNIRQQMDYPYQI